MFEVPGGLVRGSPRWLEADHLTISDASGARPFCKKQTRMESSQKPSEKRLRELPRRACWLQKGRAPDASGIAQIGLLLFKAGCREPTRLESQKMYGGMQP